MSSRRLNSTRIKLSDLSDEEIADFMDSVPTESEGEDFDSDDEMDDPNYEPDDIIELIESSEHDETINQMLGNPNLTSIVDPDLTSMVEAVSISLHLSSIGLPPASSTFRDSKYHFFCK